MSTTRAFRSLKPAASVTRQLTPHQSCVVIHTYGWWCLGGWSHHRYQAPWSDLRENKAILVTERLVTVNLIWAVVLLIILSTPSLNTQPCLVYPAFNNPVVSGFTRFMWKLSLIPCIIRCLANPHFSFIRLSPWEPQCADKRDVTV